MPVNSSNNLHHVKPMDVGYITRFKISPKGINILNFYFLYTFRKGYHLIY